MTSARDPDLIVRAWLDDGPTDLPPDMERSIAIAVRTLPQAHSQVDRLARRFGMSRRTSRLPLDDRIVRAWLDDGPTDLPPDMERSIAIAVRTLPQARSRIDRLARRIDMTRFQTLGLVAAVAIVAVVGVVAVAAFGGRQPDVGGKLGPSASSPSPDPSPSPIGSAQSSNTVKEAFTSERYGLRIVHPADWIPRQAHAFFRPAEWVADGRPADWLDALWHPEWNETFLAASALIPEGGSVDDVTGLFLDCSGTCGGTLEDFSIDGHPAKIREAGYGNRDAFVVLDDRVYVFKLLNGRRQDSPADRTGRARFEEHLSNVFLMPWDALWGWEPRLTEAFTSDAYGYSVRHPVDWTARPATGAHLPIDWKVAGMPEDWLDVFAGPTPGDTFRAWSAPIPTDLPMPVAPELQGTTASFDDWKAFHERLSDCERCHPWRNLLSSIDGHTALAFEHVSRWEALAFAGDRVYLFSMFDQGDEPHAFELFQALLDTVELQPEASDDATTGPHLTETFTSDLYGFSVDHPANWSTSPATDPIVVSDWVAQDFPKEWVDRMRDPGGLPLEKLDVVSTHVPPGADALDLLAPYTHCPDVCQALLTDTTIAGQPAQRMERFQAGRPEVWALVSVGDRAYVFTLSGGDYVGLPALFDALMATVELHPEDVTAVSTSAP